MFLICPHCNIKASYIDVECSFCRTQFELPNIRFAKNDLKELIARADIETNLAKDQGLHDELDLLNHVSQTACLSICIPIDIIADVSRSQIYSNRYNKLLGVIKKPENQDNDKRRYMVDTNLFTNFHEKIYYAAVTHKGQGLTNYGEISFYLTNSLTLNTKASLLEENSFSFFEHHNIGFNILDIPKGYRSNWEHRSRLITAKLAKKLKKGLKVNDIKSILLQNGKNMNEDDFVEAHIYADRFELKIFSECHLLVRGKTTVEQMNWDLAKHWLKATDIKVVE